jgi:hypothetical protein
MQKDHYSYICCRPLKGLLNSYLRGIPGYFVDVECKALNPSNTRAAFQKELEALYPFRGPKYNPQEPIISYFLAAHRPKHYLLRQDATMVVF